MLDQFKEWRGYTPLLLALCTILITLVAFFSKDKLDNIEAKSDKTFQLISQMNDGFSVYKIEAENRFTRLETEVADIRSRLPN